MKHVRVKQIQFLSVKQYFTIDIDNAIEWLNVAKNQGADRIQLTSDIDFDRAGEINIEAIKVEFNALEK